MDQITEIRNVSRNGITMKGVVASTDLPRGTYIGTYKGDRVSLTTVDEWIRSFRMTFGASYSTAANKVLKFAMETENDKYFILPTDRFGNVKRKYKDCKPLYINEPGPGESYNIVWIFDDINDQVHFYTFKHVSKGQELLTAYGSVYDRDYPITKEPPPYSLYIEDIHLLHETYNKK